MSDADAAKKLDGHLRSSEGPFGLLFFLHRFPPSLNCGVRKQLPVLHHLNGDGSEREPLNRQTANVRNRTDRTLRFFAVAAAAIALAGCAAKVIEGPRTQIRHVTEQQAKSIALRLTSPHSNASDWETFKGEWRIAFTEESRRLGIGYEYLEGRSKPEATVGTVVTINFNDYRYLTSGLRYGFGVMTGNAYIDAGVTFSDIATGAHLGSAKYDTTSTAWEGIFSAMTDKQVAAVTRAIFRDLRGGTLDAGSAPPAAAQPAPPTPAAPKRMVAGGQESYQVERMPEVKACNADPRALLTAKGPGFEAYSIACSNGDALAVRCEFGSCRVLR